MDDVKSVKITIMAAGDRAARRNSRASWNFARRRVAEFMERPDGAGSYFLKQAVALSGNLTADIYGRALKTVAEIGDVRRAYRHRY